jgi:hypothetical protein
VPTDPFVPVTRDEAPRHRQNLPPGLAMPPARAWYATRPGDGAPAEDLDGPLRGRPGPNIGYALTLVARQRDSWTLDPSESIEDAGAVVAEIAMKRAARFGRAPVKPDVDLAVKILGYDGTAEADWVARRVLLVLGAAHHYDVRRAAVDLVPMELLEKAPGDADAIAAWRRSAAKVSAA